MDAEIQVEIKANIQKQQNQKKKKSYKVSQIAVMDDEKTYTNQSRGKTDKVEMPRAEGVTVGGAERRLRRKIRSGEVKKLKEKGIARHKQRQGRLLWKGNLTSELEGQVLDGGLNSNAKSKLLLTR